MVVGVGVRFLESIEAEVNHKVPVLIPAGRSLRGAKPWFWEGLIPKATSEYPNATSELASCQLRPEE